jgi:ketosteroid isomerase-like protein
MRRQTCGATRHYRARMDRTSEKYESPNGDGRIATREQRILRVSPDGMTASSIETVLLKRINDLAQAIRDKNIDHLMTFYAHDVVVFDLRPPLDARGAVVYRKHFERWFASFEGPIGFDLKDLRIVPGEGAAFCHYLSHITGTRPGGRKADYWVRGTTCFELRDEEGWLVSHEHISMPTPM